MFVDYMLVLSTTLSAMEAAMRGWVAPELFGICLVGFVFGLVFLRAFGSATFRKGVEPVKIIISVAGFAFSVSAGDIRETLNDIALIIIATTGLFSFYIMFAWAFPERNNGKREWGVIIIAGAFLVMILYALTMAGFDWLRSFVAPQPPAH